MDPNFFLYYGGKFCMVALPMWYFRGFVPTEAAMIGAASVLGAPIVNKLTMAIVPKAAQIGSADLKTADVIQKTCDVIFPAALAFIWGSPMEALWAGGLSLAANTVVPAAMGKSMFF